MQREVGGLEDRVDVEEFAPGGLVEQGADAAAESGQDGGAQPVVLDDEGVEVGGGAVAGVAVAQPDRQDGAQRGIAALQGHVGGECGALPGVEPVRLAVRAARQQGGQRVLGPERRGGQGQDSASDGRGHGNLTPRLASPRGDAPARRARRPPMTMEHARGPREQGRPRSGLRKERRPAPAPTWARRDRPRGAARPSRRLKGRGLRPSGRLKRIG